MFIGIEIKVFRKGYYNNKKMERLEIKFLVLSLLIIMASSQAQVVTNAGPSSCANPNQVPVTFFGCIDTCGSDEFIRCANPQQPDVFLICQALQQGLHQRLPLTRIESLAAVDGSVVC